MATDAVGSEQVCSVLEQLRNEQHVVEYVVYDTSDVRNPKKVAGAGGLAEAGGEQAALSSMLRTVGSCLAAGETFKRMSVSYPDCVYYALVIGQYQVIYRTPRQ
eukprot:TRINITY_DN3200_c0_g1_i1.p1 TRINITY_DN3200_c0_g1~~TRINITY_DN3200_c0_g1_i1.p1  ORF type:complete len:104 (+),score=34.72 TRINITY_DN3200_c0_g1_i1:58-369(+)